MSPKQTKQHIYTWQNNTITAITKETLANTVHCIYACNQDRKTAPKETQHNVATIIHRTCQPGLPDTQWEHRSMSSQQLKAPVWMNWYPFSQTDTASTVLLLSPCTVHTSLCCERKLRRWVQRVDSPVRGTRWNRVLHEYPFHINRWELFIAAKPFWLVKI